MPEATKLPETPTLEDLVSAVGPPDPELFAAMNPPESQEAFRVVGAEIGSDRVIKDMTRLLGIAVAFWLKATDAQIALCKGCSKQLLAIAVDRALALETMKNAFAKSGTADKSSRVVRATAAGTAYQTGASLRDRARTGLRTVTGTNETRKSELAVAVGTIKDHESLAQSLERLADLTERYLRDPTTRARTVVAGLVEGDAAILRSEASSVRTEGKAASGRLTSRPVGQGELDALDGLCLDLLSHIIHAFDTGHDEDGKIPRLVPQSARRVLASRSAPKPVVVIEPAGPSDS